MSRSGCYFAWGLVVLAVGCGDSDTAATARVQGQVTIDGQLVSRGTVNFYPTSDGPVATGRIHEDGSYSLRVGQGNTNNPDASKIVPGEYTATVVVRSPPDPATSDDSGGPPDAGQRLSAAKYASAETSGLTFDVNKGMNVLALNIEGASADAEEEAISEGADDEGGEVFEEGEEPGEGEEADATTSTDSEPEAEATEEEPPVNASPEQEPGA